MTAAPTPTATSSARSSRGAGKRRSSHRPTSFEAGITILSVGLGLFWLVFLALRSSSGTGVDGADPGLRDAWAFDLAAYVNAAIRLIDDGSLYAAELIAAPFEPGPADLFYYAPPLGVAMLPFTGLSVADSAVIWWAMRVAALLLACLVMPVRPVIRALAFAVVAFSLPGLKDSILGNVSLLLLLPMVMAWRWMDRPVGSIALAAAMSVRPGLGIFLVWQLLRRQWRAALWTVAGGCALVIVTLPFVGLQGYLDYVAVIGHLNVPAGLSENSDLGGTAIALGADPAIAGLARLLSIAAALTAILVSLRRDREISYMVTLSASLLLVPLLWDHYLATLVVPAAFLAQRVHPALIVLPLLSWVGILSPFLVAAMMLLPLLARDDEGPEQARGTLTQPAGESTRV